MSCAATVPSVKSCCDGFYEGFFGFGFRSGRKLPLPTLHPPSLIAWMPTTPSQDCFLQVRPAHCHSAVREKLLRRLLRRLLRHQENGLNFSAEQLQAFKACFERGMTNGSSRSLGWREEVQVSTGVSMQQVNVCIHMSPTPLI